MIKVKPVSLKSRAELDRILKEKLKTNVHKTSLLSSADYYMAVQCPNCGELQMPHILHLRGVLNCSKCDTSWDTEDMVNGLVPIRMIKLGKIKS